MLSVFPTIAGWRETMPQIMRRLAYDINHGPEPVVHICRPMVRPGRLTSERALAGRASEITAMPIRTLQDRAAQGLVPGAAKLGGRWSFNEVVLRMWVKQQEAIARQGSLSVSQKDVSSAAPSGGAASKSAAQNTANRYEQLIRSRRANAARNG